MTAEPVSADRPGSTSRWARRGFLTGVVVAVLTPFVALMSVVGEMLLPFLVPASEVLRPLSDVMSDWNAVLSLALVGALNGALYALAAVVLAGAYRLLRRRP